MGDGAIAIAIVLALVTAAALGALAAFALFERRRRRTQNRDWTIEPQLVLRRTIVFDASAPTRGVPRAAQTSRVVAEIDWSGVARRAPLGIALAALVGGTVVALLLPQSALERERLERLAAAPLERLGRWLFALAGWSGGLAARPPALHANGRSAPPSP